MQHQIKNFYDANSSTECFPPNNVLKNFGPYTVENYEDGVMWVVKDVLSQKECDFYIQYAEFICGFKESTPKNPFQAKFDSRRM